MMDLWEEKCPICGEKFKSGVAVADYMPTALGSIMRTKYGEICHECARALQNGNIKERFGGE